MCPMGCETIAPDFEEMLYAAEERGEAYLIQSHQRLNDTGKIENEDGRSQTLYRLQDDHRNFHVVFQAVEGDLFNHRGDYAEITTFAELKAALKASFYDESSPNRLPAALQKNEIYRNQVLDQLLDTVHQTIFGGREDIAFDGDDPTHPGHVFPEREWQAFILAFYILQGDDLKFRLPNVKYFCTNCKNFFDRGGDRAMAEDRLHQEMSTRDVSREQLEETIGNLVPVPLQSKGKGVIIHRLQPGLALADILTGLDSEARQRLQAVSCGDYKFDRFEVSKRPEHQRAVPLVEDAHTPQEMQEVFKSLQGRRRYLTDNQMVEKNWAVYQERREALFKQVDRDLARFDIRIDGTRYDRKVWYLGTTKYNAEGIYELLTETRGMTDEAALKVLAQIHQGVFAEPLIGLNAAFEHQELHLKVAHAPGASIQVTTTGDEIEIRGSKRFQYIADDTEDVHFRETPFAVFDTTVALSIPKDGRNATGSWTWKVVDVPV